MSARDIAITPISSGGDVIGTGLSGSGHIVGKTVNISGNIIQLVDPSPEAIERLNLIAAINTEVRPKSAEGEAKPDFEGLQKGLNEVLNVVKTLENKGQDTDEIQGGGINITRVELLLKKAVLLKIEADQMYFDQVEKNKPRVDRGTGQQFQVDLANLMEGFDASGHEMKLKEAYELLDQASRLDPANTEVLLHMAQVLDQLEPDDQAEQRKILYRVLNLLSEPQNETEKFRRAQATFLLASASDQLNPDLLRDARAMFVELNRTEWVRQCDFLLAGAGQAAAGPPQFVPQQPAFAGFNPIGQWQIRVTDGTVITASFFPNGTCQGIQQGAFGMTSQFAGQWGFIPQNQFLQIQGMVNGFMPFMLAMSVQLAPDGTFFGSGNDGKGYSFFHI